MAEIDCSVRRYARQTDVFRSFGAILPLLQGLRAMQRTLAACVLEVQSTLNPLLLLLQEPHDGDAVIPTARFPPNQHANEGSVVSSSSSSGGENPHHHSHQHQREALEIRRSLRRLDRALEGVRSHLPPADTVDEKDPDRGAPTDGTINRNDPALFELPPLLLTVLTTLWNNLEDCRTMNGWIHDEVLQLYESTVIRSSEMLVHDSLVTFPLEDIHLDELVDRTAQLLCKDKFRDGDKFRTTFCGVLQVLMTHIAQRHEAGQELFPTLTTLEALELLQLALPTSLRTLQVRCDRQDGEDAASDELQLECRANLFALATYLLRQLVSLMGGTADSHGEVDGWLQRQFLTMDDAGLRYPHPTMLRQDIDLFFRQCLSMATECVDYVQDAMDGVLLLVGAKNDGVGRADGDHLDMLVREAVVRHVATACLWIETVETGLHLSLLSSAQSLFQATTSFVANVTCSQTLKSASTCYTSFFELRQFTSEWLIQLARTVVLRKDRHEQTAISTDRAVQRGVIITLWFALNNGRVVIDDIQFLLDYLGGSRRTKTTAASKKRKSLALKSNNSSSRNPPMLLTAKRQIQATILACLTLPAASGETVSKEFVAGMVQTLSSSSSSSSLQDPWDAVLARKISESYGTLKRRGQSTLQDRRLGHFVYANPLLANGTASAQREEEEDDESMSISGNKDTTRTPKRD